MVIKRPIAKPEWVRLSAHACFQPHFDHDLVNGSRSAQRRVGVFGEEDRQRPGRDPQPSGGSIREKAQVTPVVERVCRSPALASIRPADQIESANHVLQIRIPLVILEGRGVAAPPEVARDDREEPIPVQLMATIGKVGQVGTTQEGESRGKTRVAVGVTVKIGESTEDHGPRHLVMGVDGGSRPGPTGEFLGPSVPEKGHPVWTGRFSG